MLIYPVVYFPGDDVVLIYPVVYSLDGNVVLIYLVVYFPDGNVVLKKFLTLTTHHQFECDVTATDSAGKTDGPNNLHIYIDSKITL